MKFLSTALRVASLAALGAALNAHSGGPLLVQDGCSVKYPGTVTQNYDRGSLGTLSKSQAIVTESSAAARNVISSVRIKGACGFALIS